MKILGWFIRTLWHLLKKPFVALKKQRQKELDREHQKKSASWLFYFVLLLMASGSLIAEFSSNEILPLLCYLAAFVILLLGIDVIFYFADLLVSEHIKRKPPKLFFLFVLVVKEIVVCLLILFCLAIPTVLLIYWIKPFYLLENHPKGFFIILVFIVFVVALLLYYLFSKSILRQRFTVFFLKSEHVEKNSIAILQLRRYKEEAAPIIDLFVILATVALLANSTISVADFSDTYTSPNVYASIEGITFLKILSVYLMAAYYKFVEIIAVSKSD